MEGWTAGWTVGWMNSVTFSLLSTTQPDTSYYLLLIYVILEDYVKLFEYYWLAGLATNVFRTNIKSPLTYLVRQRSKHVNAPKKMDIPAFITTSIPALPDVCISMTYNTQISPYRNV
jgi:hypothetical protein